MELIKHVNSVNLYSNIELPKKYRPELEGGMTNSCINQAVF